MWFIGSFALVGFMFLLSWLLGHALLSAFGFRMPFWKPESVALGGVLGAAVLVLSSGYISWLGYPMRGNGVILTSVLVLVALITLGLTGRHPPTSRNFPDHRNMLPLLGLLALIGFVSYLGLLSLLRDNAFVPYNDTIASISLGEYLQDHSFNILVSARVQSPVAAMTNVYQELNLRMGVHFFLALVQSWVPFSRNIEVFPAVSVFGVILDLLTVYLCCRWMIRMPVFYSLCGCLFGFANLSAAFYSVDWGFMNQLYGIAFCFTGLVLVGRLLTDATTPRRWVAPLAVVSAALVSAYNELLPIYGMILLAAFGLRSLAAGRWSWRAVIHLLLAGGGTVLLANIELSRAIKNIAFQMRIAPGGNIPYTMLQFAGSWLGVYPGPYDQGFYNAFIGNGFLYWCCNIIGAMVSVLVVYGLACLAAKRRYLRLAEFSSALVVFAGLIGYFALFVKNPFLPGHMGQTWSISKLVQYSFPLGVCLIVFAVRRLPCKKSVILGFGVAMTLIYWPVHDSLCHQKTEIVRVMTQNTDQPFQAYEDFAATVRRKANGLPVRMIIPASTCHHIEIAVYYLYPDPVASDDWRTSPCVYLGSHEKIGFLNPLPPYAFTLASVIDPTLDGEQLPAGFLLQREAVTSASPHDPKGPQ